MLLDLIMSHEKMSDFVSFLLSRLTLVIKKKILILKVIKIHYFILL